MSFFRLVQPALSVSFECFILPQLTDGTYQRGTFQLQVPFESSFFYTTVSRYVSFCLNDMPSFVRVRNATQSLSPIMSRAAAKVEGLYQIE
jgi:hypothetical protein